MRFIYPTPVVRRYDAYHYIGLDYQGIDLLVEMAGATATTAVAAGVEAGVGTGLKLQIPLLVL